MPTERAVRDLRPVRRSELTAGVRRLGLPEGTLVFVHASLSSLGWVVGGAETVVRALLDAVGPRGTVAAVASWDDIPFRLERWPLAWRRAYLDEMPGFDPALSEANRLYGRLPERLRTWPGARKSAHPDQRVVAVGRLASWLTSAHPLDDGFGAGTPFARLVEAGGQVLMLGAPLQTLTLLHHAEAIAAVPGKRRWSYSLPFATVDGRRWRRLNDIDVDGEPLPYGAGGMAQMASAALAAGIGVRGRVGAAESHLFPAVELVAFATRWLEERFGSRIIEAQAKASVNAANEPSRNSEATAFTAGVMPYLTWVKMYSGSV
jgi:aminoglycoside 3-N-acetyltransferase